MKALLLSAICAAALLSQPTAARAQGAGWTLEGAAAPLKGTEVNVTFLDRPGYRAIIKLLPEFEKRTGIKVHPFQGVHYLMMSTIDAESISKAIVSAEFYFAIASGLSSPMRGPGNHAPQAS